MVAPNGARRLVVERCEADRQRHPAANKQGEATARHRSGLGAHHRGGASALEPSSRVDGRRTISSTFASRDVPDPQARRHRPSRPTGCSSRAARWRSTRTPGVVCTQIASAIASPLSLRNPALAAQAIARSAPPQGEVTALRRRGDPEVVDAGTRNRRAPDRVQPGRRPPAPARTSRSCRSGRRSSRAARRTQLQRRGPAGSPAARTCGRRPHELPRAAARARALRARGGCLSLSLGDLAKQPPALAPGQATGGPTRPAESA